MNKRIIIGILGRKIHGKDTIADMICKKYAFRKISFADPLKEGCRNIFGLTEEQLYGIKKDVIDEYWKVTPRSLIQFVGTDLLRNQFCDLIWIKLLEKKLIHNSAINFVISDIRFQNELDMLKKHGAIIIKVHRPGLPNEDNHISEVGIDNVTGFDEYILNDSSIDMLYYKVDQILKHYKTHKNKNI